ncbi:siderophore-interacting protein [Rhizobium sp. WW_1]|jgi:NADPH-dependent ferric siderophore reductase|uniref:siderophore-interacting protein n=1 Tax=Rhizobium sp. WW_1 TaxID=1907375 RepID=UPI000689B83C|nr:siderophore-interacting protein [Rhizobium sp. WW_1]RKD35950.1 NADPH-dependent ferric siderophore reductase [Rhizobium sp. WW_1]
MAVAQANDSARRAPGRLTKTLLGLFMKHATVAAIDDTNDRFRLVTLEGPALQGVEWKPGQKVQIAMGSAFSSRTYTSMSWDAIAGRTRILGFLHGDGPGSVWLRGLKTGDECDLFGPRSSLGGMRTPAPLAVIGDETSLGLAHALISMNWNEALTCCFEVTDVAGVHQVLTPLGLQEAALIAKRDNDAHLDKMEATLGAPATAGASFILTGKAGTIQRLRQYLIRQAVPPARILTRAHWAPGKQGLD